MTARMTDSRANRIRRLIYRSSYTGMRETDKLLGEFARANLHLMDDAELDAFEELLAAGDPAIWAQVSGQAGAIDSDNPALARLMEWTRDKRP